MVHSLSLIIEKENQHNKKEAEGIKSIPSASLFI